MECSSTGNCFYCHSNEVCEGYVFTPVYQSFCSQGLGSASRGGRGTASRAGSASGGLHPEGQWGLHPGGRGSASRGSLHPGGLHPGGMGSASRGSASRGFASRGLHLGGLHPGRSAFRGVGRPPPPIRYYGIRSTSGCTDPTGMHSCIEVKLIS